ncbi:hypothetical protein C8J57DRAFT_1645088 [Mycena rebaudengoi]|nr:hypothetical protein C8J57DRAFT_1645088 [Mycena rebaudengoi]
MERISDAHDSASDADLDAPSQPDDPIKYTTCSNYMPPIALRRAPMGGAGGSGYAPVRGVEASSDKGIDLIMNEVEDVTVMLAVLRVFHPDAHRSLMNESEAADKMGKSGVNTYRCTNYCATQHEDSDVCRGLCLTLNLKALPWEYGFCQPSYGYYLHPYENTLWMFDGNRIHGTMLPAKQKGWTKDKFFSPVILYLVLSSIKLDGGLILTNSITQRIAHLMYSGRSVIILEIECLLAAHPNWNFHMYRDHTNGYVTPLVAIFQLFTLLKIITQTEIAPCDRRWADVHCQIVDWKGVQVARDKLCCLYNALIEDIETIFRHDVFFDKPIPPNLSAKFFRDKNLADPAMNHGTGFCALDHPPNGFCKLAHNYLRWILSDPDLCARFTYYADGDIHWRPVPVKQLMGSCDLLGLKIALTHQVSAPCLSRATEVAHMSLRNTVGSTTHNFQIILNTIALISILDKTTHKRLNYRHIPSASLLESGKHSGLESTVRNSY